MSKVTPEQIKRLQEKADQHNAKLQAAKARLAETERKLDTRRKIIAGGLLFDAASKDKQWAHHLAALLTRIDRPNDKEPFEGWSIEQYKLEGGKLGDKKRAKIEAAVGDDDAGV
ncbi:mobilization protein [Acidisoma silvae]|uniref:Mobilization protein n=1 Tax=Acidisoma silvae TaxID=2802396 RepID=A0A964E1D8_9PROT|nr:mobilization protein [Acidisoma silvae]MCB8878475.1 mobilization protein [Acidisoma silvae]